MKPSPVLIPNTGSPTRCDVRKGSKSLPLPQTQNTNSSGLVEGRRLSRFTSQSHWLVQCPWSKGGLGRERGNGKKSEGTQARIPVASRAALLSFPDLLSQNTLKAAGLRNDNPRSSLARLSVGRRQINQLSAVITIKGLSTRKGKSCGEKTCKESTQGLGGGSPSPASQSRGHGQEVVFPGEVPASSERLHPVKKTEGNPSLTFRE